MLLPDAVRAVLARRYRSQRCAWLTGEGNWPLSISLASPGETEAQRQPDAVREWASAWRAWSGTGEIIWHEHHWRSLGTHSLPLRLRLRDAAKVAEFIGEARNWRRASERYLRLSPRWPRVSRYFEVLSDYPDVDIDRLEALLDWLDRNPTPSMYPRQLPIAGIDTKWLEPRLPLIADLRGGNEMGLRPVPYLVRLCILDRELRQRVGGLSDISARFDELAALDLPASRVYIVENIQTGLAFEEERGAVVFMGLGYGVTSMARLPWVARARCIYWGDLDTHGFAILDRARSALPGLESALMDEETLLAFRDLWVHEGEQHYAATLPMLTAAEQDVYRGLKEQRWSANVRLEQERIPWSFALRRLLGL